MRQVKLDLLSAPAESDVTRLAQLAAKRRLRVVGLMSGTSADGVDAAIVDITPARARLLAFETFRYPAAMRRAVLALSAGEGDVADVCHLNFALGEVFGMAAIKLADRSGIALKSIDLVGSHGQTICHLPADKATSRWQAGLPAGRRAGGRRIRSTLQIAEPSVIAERTGITTVADFRPRDMAAGGQGAPLVPYADYVLFAHKRLTRAIQNIGGIANVTYLPAGGELAEVIAFDTGPGNMIIDRVTELVTDGRQRFDRNGRMAAKGKVNETLLAELMRHPFCRRRPPKTTGREDFGQAFADDFFRRARKLRIDPPSIVATATAFTAESIARAYDRLLPGAVDEVILCGGGARNPVLTEMLRRRLPDAKLLTTDDFGISADAKEAVSFAILAAETIRGRPGNIPSATGASRPVILGKIIPAST